MAWTSKAVHDKGLKVFAVLRTTDEVSSHIRLELHKSLIDTKIAYLRQINPNKRRYISRWESE